MKKGWETRKLGEVCSFKSGTTIDGKFEKNSGEIVYIKVGDMNLVGNENFITLSSRYVDATSIRSEQIIPIGSIIFPKRGGAIATNKKRRILRPTIVDLNIMALVPSAIIDHDYLYYWFQLTDLSDLSNGTSIPQINNYSFENVYIAFPISIQEQKRIVNILIKAFAAIDKAKANTEKNLQNVRELFESYLDGVFGKTDGEVRKLRDICEISSNLIDPKKKEFQNLIHIGAGNIESRTGELFDLKTAKEENLISGKFLFDESMVLYSKIRPYLMKVVKCEFSGLCSADIYPLKPFDDIVTKDFLYQILLSKVFTDYAILGSQRAGMPKVNREHLFEYEVILPSIQKQKVIVKNLDLINYELKRLEKNYRSKLSNLDELKKVTLGKAFMGEL